MENEREKEMADQAGFDYGAAADAMLQPLFDAYAFTAKAAKVEQMDKTKGAQDWGQQGMGW